uniref:PGG domain-containing protein n=1 Tax=Quercus lobata TaxID=97700 RepID=A0A7N2L7H5_QUELO
MGIILELFIFRAGFATLVLTLEDNMFIPICKDALLWLIKQICWIIFESHKLCKLDATGADTCELLDNEGRTALHLAVETGIRNAVKIFLKECLSRSHDKRLDKWAMNKEGMNTADIIQLDTRLLSSEKVTLMRQKDLNDFMKHGIVHSEVKAGMGGANNVKDSPPKDNTSPKDNTHGRDTPIAKFNITAMTIFTTVTFAAAFQVPGGYKDKTEQYSFHSKRELRQKVRVAFARYCEA